MKNSIILVIIIFLVILVLAGYLWYKNQQRVPAPPLGPEDFTQRALPDTTSLFNPLEKKPDINPLDKTNPFKGLYKNPFE